MYNYQKMATTQSCQVRVGVRVRPLTSKETSEGGKSVVECNPFNHTVQLSKRQFTYDSVFHSNVDQIDLYNDVSPPLINAFLGGYNATGESQIYIYMYDDAWSRFCPCTNHLSHSVSTLNVI